MLTYEEGVAPFRDTNRLSENDKAALMGGNIAGSIFTSGSANVPIGPRHI